MKKKQNIIQSQGHITKKSRENLLYTCSPSLGHMCDMLTLWAKLNDQSTSLKLKCNHSGGKPKFHAIKVYFFWRNRIIIIAIFSVEKYNSFLLY